MSLPWPVLTEDEWHRLVKGDTSVLPPDSEPPSLTDEWLTPTLRTAAGGGNPNHAPAGTPIGGQFTSGNTKVISQLYEAVRNGTGGLSIIPPGEQPDDTKFVLPDGTRLTGPGEHGDLIDNALSRTTPRSYNSVLYAGVVRYSPNKGGIEVRVPLTEQQAQLLSDDWNFVYQGPLHVDMGNYHKTFHPPFTADALRFWTTRAAFKTAGGVGSGNFDHAGRPGTVGGSAPGTGDGRSFFHGTVQEQIDSIRHNGLKTDYAGLAWPMLSQPGTIYLAETKADAMLWAESAALKLEWKFQKPTAAVLEVHVPQAVLDTATDRPKLDGPLTGGLRLKQDIPPEWITGVTIGRGHDDILRVPPNWIPSDWKNRGAAEHTKVFYVGIVISNDAPLRTAGGPGSGNFGHAGRPGEIGGSGPSSHLPDRFPDGRKHISRGLVVETNAITDKAPSPALAKKFVNGTATLDEVLSLVSVNDVGNNWWDHTQPDFNDSAEEYASVESTDTFATALPVDQHQDEVIGSMGVVLHGAVPNKITSDEWAGSIQQKNDLRVPLVRVDYNAGNGWHQLDAHGHMVIVKGSR